MRPHRPIGLLLLSAILHAGAGPALAGDSAAESALKTKGLAKTGRVFVVEDEVPALAKFKEVRSSFAAYVNLADKKAAFERYQTESARLEEQRAELKTNLDDLNQRIFEQLTSQAGNNGPGRPGQGPGQGQGQGQGLPSPLASQRDQVKAMLEEVTLGQKSLKAEAPVVQDKAALEEEIKKRAEAFKADLASLRTQFDQVTKKYAGLAADPLVKNALAELEKAGKKVKLGPSDAFVAASKELDQAERRFLGKKPATTTSTKKKTTTRSKR